ncbi:hypothetical protein HY570_02265, partial [Candidatus Micrarchaeota archaeon]|nr:hypothetical protein [Candidatus Micrarchaeota archaeon]
IMMRSLPFLRGFGGALISISLGLFIFYPFMLVLDALLFLPLYNNLTITDPLLTRASALFIAAVFLPALNFVIISAFTRELSHLFGGDVDVSKLSQMI